MTKLEPGSPRWRVTPQINKQEMEKETRQKHRAEHQEQLRASTADSLEEMAKSLKTHSPSKLNQEEIL